MHGQIELNINSRNQQTLNMDFIIKQMQAAKIALVF